MDAGFCLFEACKQAGKEKGFKSDPFDNRDTQTIESDEDEDFLQAQFNPEDLCLVFRLLER